MPYVVLAQYLLLIFLISTVHCAIQFQYDSEQCLGELVEYQCTVTGSTLLTWIILREDGTEFGSHTFPGNRISTPATIGGVFSVNQSLFSPSIVSNISFTVLSSINGYSIHCEDFNENNKNLTIQVTGPPPPPNSLRLSFSQSEVMVTWTPPSYISQCYSIASYTVNTTSTIISTTDTNVTIPLAGLSPGIYCVSVASVDTANRTGTYSEEKCSPLSVPNAPSVNYTSFNGTTQDSAIVRISSDFGKVIPPLINVHISDNVTNNVTIIPAADSNDTLFTITRGIDYQFTVFGENIVANGPNSTIRINVDIDEELPMAPTTETTDPTNNTTMNTTNTTNNTTNSGDSPNDDSGPPTIVIIIIIIVVIILIGTVVVIVVIMIVYCKKKSKSVNPDKNSGGIELKKTAQPIPASDDPSFYADLEIAATKKSQKKAAAGRGGGSSQPASATNYSAVKHEVVYTDVSHSVPAGKKPTPAPTVNYSAVTH